MIVVDVNDVNQRMMTEIKCQESELAVSQSGQGWCQFSMLIEAKCQGWIWFNLMMCIASGITLRLLALTWIDRFVGDIEVDITI